MKTVQPIRSQPPAWQWRWKQSHMPSAGLPLEATVRPHMPSSSQIQWACYKTWNVERELAQTGCVDGRHPPSKTPVGVPLWTCRSEGKWPSRQTGGKKQPSQVACFSEDLKCWGAWDTTCGHKAKDITPSIAWRREALKEEALDDRPWKDERGPSSIRRIYTQIHTHCRAGQCWLIEIFWDEKCLQFVSEGRESSRVPGVLREIVHSLLFLIELHVVVVLRPVVFVTVSL